MIDAKEAIRFFKVQLGRCRINLQGAKDRRDQRAIGNIQRKMEIYQFVINALQNNKGGTDEQRS